MAAATTESAAAAEGEMREEAAAPALRLKGRVNCGLHLLPGVGGDVSFVPFNIHCECSRGGVVESKTSAAHRRSEVSLSSQPG